jgi:hypothetical protein
MTDTGPTAQGVPHVYQAITSVIARLAKEGIGKDRKNEQQGYKFRGIDDVYNALAPILAENQLCILPRVQSREVVERQTRSGSPLFYVNVSVDFHFVSAKDGSTHIVAMPGEAMDSADKATNKAMSAAYKYACLQAFCIPTEGDNDADGTTHQVAPAETAVRTPDTVAKASTRSKGATVKAVSQDEVDTITKLAGLAGVPLETIAGKYGVNSIQELPLSKTAEVVARLQELATSNAVKEAA